MKLGDGSKRVWKALVSHVQKSLHKNRILQKEKEINEKIVHKEWIESWLTLKQVAWSDPSSSGTSLRIAWISSGAHLALIALTSLADIIQVMLFSVSGKASYLNVGSGLSGANPRNEPGTLSTTRWWYESLKKKIQFFVVFKQKVWSRIRKRRFEAKREKELGAEEQKKKETKTYFPSL